MPIPVPIPAVDRSTYEIPGPARVLILPDVHVPFHDPEALRAAVDYGKKYRPTHILLNGDFIDFYACSFFQTNPKLRDLAGEISAANECLAWLMGQFPKAQIVWKEGNHEERWDRYVMSKAPELFGVITTRLEAQFPDGFVWVREKRRLHLGKLLILHGHEYRWAIQNPVSPARGLMLRARVSALCSHFHQRSEHSTRDGNGKLLTTWSTGCLCQLAPDYAPFNEWSHGFATATVDKNGAFEVSNHKIIDGKLWT